MFLLININIFGLDLEGKVMENVFLSFECFGYIVVWINYCIFELFIVLFYFFNICFKSCILNLI